LRDPDGQLGRHLQAAAGTLCLIRPDAYLAATLHHPEPAALVAALRRVMGGHAEARPAP
jgi:3-(3-hydroxy-phenyl)propionate hydroxylase